ncbi:hypothetical protein NXS19_007038 [Fusarium pseudograminearum]|nr:hypothetical protein NXS19_007038 [Fusarium pseudograminearum]
MAFAPIGPLTGEHGQALSKLLTEGIYSDLKITCGTDEYAVHKAIVCSRSPVFARAIGGVFTEAKTDIKLPDDDPVAVKMMINYLYTQSYVPPEAPAASESETTSTQKLKPEPVSAKRQCSLGFAIWAAEEPLCPYPCCASFRPPAPPRPPNLVLHAKIYQLGEKYGMKDLMALSLYKFRDEAVTHHHSDSFRHAARFVYGSTVTQDRGMRNAVVQAVKTNIDLLDDKAFQVVIKGTELGFDLLLSLTQTRRGELKREASSL